MDLVRPFVRENYARWLVEQPEWFTPEWIARVPPEFLEDLDLTLIVPVADASSKQEITFRQSATAKPWCLGAEEMAGWLEDNWLAHEGISHPDRARDLVQQLSEASGFELLARATSVVPTVCAHRADQNRREDLGQPEARGAYQVSANARWPDVLLSAVLRVGLVLAAA